MRFAIRFFHGYFFHFVKSICNDIIVTIGKTQQIIIILIPHHKRRAYGITIAVFPINLFMLLIVIKVKERYLLVLVYCALDGIHVIDKRTAPFSALIKRNNVL